jgi:hypothetical protein
MLLGWIATNHNVSDMVARQRCRKTCVCCCHDKEFKLIVAVKSIGVRLYSRVSTQRKCATIDHARSNSAGCRAVPHRLVVDDAHLEFCSRCFVLLCVGAMICSCVIVQHSSNDACDKRKKVHKRAHKQQQQQQQLINTRLFKHLNISST